MFGRLAAKQNRIHYCILDEADLGGTDSNIKHKIRSEVRLWKHRALDAGPTAPSGFVLLAVHPKIVSSRPDDKLRQLALKLRQLWGLPVERDLEGNDYALEELYIRNPVSGSYLKFTFTADFFAAAGDRTWWHDHRIPGGIAFTANSLGHMARHQEWYQNGKDGIIPWALRLAMQTIASASQTDVGPATWLLDLKSGEPLKPLACPFANGQALPKYIEGKDWTSYAGFHHTDHSIRSEYFKSSEHPWTEGREWFMDLSYIFNPAEEDFVKFMAGQEISKNEIDRNIGTVSDRRRLSPIRNRTSSARERVIEALRDTEPWQLSEGESADLLPP